MNIDNNETTVAQVPANLQIFWILMIPSALNVPCSILVLSIYLLNRKYRTELHNHHNLLILPINLFYQLSNIAFTLYFYRTGQLVSTSVHFRTFWGYIDWAFLTMQFWLFAWATIERHILIFHSHLLSTRIKRLFVYYLPLLIIPTYCVIYYSFVIFSVNCQNIDPRSVSPSFYPCAFLDNSTLYLYETVCHEIVPVFLVVIANVFLLIRVIWQKYRIHQEVRWRQHRRMTIQVLSISFLYLLFPMPYFFVVLLGLVGVSISGIAPVIELFGILLYYVAILYPVICFFSMSEVQKVISKLYRQKMAVGPINVITDMQKERNNLTVTRSAVNRREAEV